MKIVISSHLDTVFTHPYLRIYNGTSTGANDNVAGCLAAARLLEVPDVYIEFTEEEEMHMDGARYVAKKHSPEDTLMIVIDQTTRGKHWDKINFTVENVSGVKMNHIKKALKGHNYKVNPNGEESEAWLYREMGFAVIEIDVPVAGGMHSLDSKVRVEDIVKTGEALKALVEYFKDKIRSDISDIYKVE